MAAKALPAQRDFSGGEVDLAAKRSDQDRDNTELLRAGCRQLSNFRILNSGAAQNRPGRRAQFVAAQNARVEEVTISPGFTVRLSFSNNRIDINDLNNVPLFGHDSMPWSTAQLGQLVYAVLGQSIYITSPTGQPQVLTYTGGLWSVTPYTPAITTGGQHRSIFYRLSALGVVMQPSATTGAITIGFSPGVASFSVAMIGSLMRYCGRQILITGYTSAVALSGTVLEPLPPGQALKVTLDPRGIFNVGDVLIGATSGAKGIITGLGATTVTVQLTSNAINVATGGTATDGSTPTLTTGFIAGEVIASPGGSDQITTGGGDVINTVPQPVAIWDDEIFNSYRGYPKSCFADQGRLGFCNFPSIPNGVAWSAIGAPTDLYVDSLPSSAFFELTPDKTQIYFVLAGPESSEFVFCDKRIYYIPISPANPLKPGSVSFQILSASGAAQVQPRAVEESIIYISAGLSSVMAIVAPGAYYRPYGTRNLSRLRSHLIKSPNSIAVPTSQGTFDETYIYILNADGTLAVGKFETENGQIKGLVAWTAWSGAGSVLWCSARDSTVLFSTIYNGVNIIEVQDDTVYLDAAIYVHNPPPALNPPPPSAGPLFFWVGQTVSLMDLVTRTLGTYSLDNNGNIIPQNNGGEDLTVPTLVAGQPWTATIEPFVPAVPPGQDSQQRMRKRRVSRFEVYVAQSTGFRVDSLNADQQGAILPAIGNPQTSRRVPAYNQDDDVTQPPPYRERAYVFRPKGRAHDPRNAIIKDTPGPLQVLEIAMEVTV